MQGTVTRLRTNIGERADLLALVCDVYCDFVFPFGILGQVWYLIVSIPGPCCLFTLKIHHRDLTIIITLFFKNRCYGFWFNIKNSKRA